MSGTVLPVGSPESFAAQKDIRLPTHRHHRKLQIALIVVGAIAFLLFATQLALSGLYNGRFLPGVTVAGHNLGGMTRPEARKALEAQADTVRVQFTVGSKTYNLKPAEVGAQYDLNATLDQAYLSGRQQTFMPLALWQARQEEVRYAYKLDSKAQQAFIDKVVADSGQAPVDATVVIKDGVPTVEADKQGKALDAKLVANVINDQLSGAVNGRRSLAPATQEARIRTADAEPAVAAVRQLLATPIQITYQGKSFIPTPAQMGEWISFDKTSPDAHPGLTPKMNLDGIKHYLQSVAKEINVNPVNRKVNVMNGDSKEERAGVDGLQLDQDKLADQLASAIMAKQALVAEAPTKKVPFQTETNRSVQLDYGKYIEVNLTRQRLWVYQDHKVIYESPVTSGAAGQGWPTVEGLFSIQAKQTNRNLNGYAIGYNYNVFVKYWMPFHADYGLHDASWRNGSFGGQDYYYGGSHGCVNLPEATAAFLFGWADVGTPVWVHE